MAASKVQAAPRTRAASIAIPTGILTITSVLVEREGNAYRLIHLPRFHGIPILAIALLDLANSGDFPANVFNQIPVPHFAMALMALGATFALVMSIIGFIDANRSWRNIKLLRQERQELLAREVVTSDSEDEKQSVVQAVDPAILSLNQRDMRVEFFERCGMETVMGTAAFLVAVGTYMAIGGANRKVFLASNLLSGYIGNAPTALYGLINTCWSCIAWHRARRQRKSALMDLKKGPVSQALKSRTQSIERHAIFSGITCLVSGALGLLTPTHWQPYPVLLVCGLLFIHTTWVFRTRVAYIRPMLSRSYQVLVTEEIHEELEHLLQVQANAKKERTFLSQASFGNVLLNPFAVNFGSVVRIGLFERFCEQVLADKQLNDRLSEEWGNIGKISYSDFLHVDQDLQPALNEVAKTCMAKHGPQQVSIQTRFLLEALGTCLITNKNGSPSKAAA